MRSVSLVLVRSALVLVGLAAGCAPAASAGDGAVPDERADVVTPEDAASDTPAPPDVPAPLDVPVVPDVVAVEAAAEAALEAAADASPDEAPMDVPAIDAAPADVAPADVRPDLGCVGSSSCPGPDGMPRCTNLATDRANCGMCGRACCSTEVCNGGSCVAACMPGAQACSVPGGTCLACVTLQTDVANCGACNRACPAGNTCVSGVCRAPTCATVSVPAAPMGVCDGRGMIACQRWAQAAAGGNPMAVSVCLSMPAGCARADQCTAPSMPSTCRCGGAPACGPNEVCVLSGPTARCVCATAP